MLKEVFIRIWIYGITFGIVAGGLSVWAESSNQARKGLTSYLQHVGVK